MDELYLVDIVRDDLGTVRIIEPSAVGAARVIEHALQDEHVSSGSIRLFRLTRVEYEVTMQPTVHVLGDEPLWKPEPRVPSAAETESIKQMHG